MAAPPYSPKTICLHGLQSRAKYQKAAVETPTVMEVETVPHHLASELKLPWHERCLVEVRA
jgi:hypothetical protein